MAAQVLDDKAALGQPSTAATLPPEYSRDERAELTESLPTYDNAVASRACASRASCAAALATAGLRPTHTYQIEARGRPLVALPLAPRASAIDIVAVLPDGSLGPLAYRSLRRARCSGDSVLVRADDPLAREEPLCSTTYRFGPGRPPRIRLQGEVAHEEELEVTGGGLHTRAQNMRTHLGTFQWRYASRRERRAAGASSLLVMEEVSSAAPADGKTAERRRRVAQLVRSEELRTPGTTRATAGNGGRLVMDLTGWAGRKADARAMEVLVLSGCVVMLKKEVDRRRAAQFMVLAGAAGGGP
ncbi:uncharacterized protein MAM_00981 [Metarhizium album ARSEF 1941]|uniref:Uncharacterized protein n=1 Tax=Metarhizium album (strain ARSEF 1941) TaxID=1081103 RepID=A0A0B2X8U7_METAS|nr:uncharacterized protein MAM_00981 [Metarhizium album ARSEF 1941]KHO01980.1 hypothetical protein MAM_00981 [Metarhizium album ARSEF 1941]